MENIFYPASRVVIYAGITADLKFQEYPNIVITNGKVSKLYANLYTSEMHAWDGPATVAA